MTASAWIWIVSAFVLANLPFVNQRVGGLGPLRPARHWSVRKLEWLVGVGLALGLGRWLEGQQMQTASQGWEYYTIVFMLMSAFAFPGFAWQYLRRA